MASSQNGGSVSPSRRRGVLALMVVVMSIYVAVTNDIYVMSLRDVLFFSAVLVGTIVHGV